MKVPEVIEVFQRSPICDRVYLICQLLQRCISYELLFIKTVLTGSLLECKDTVTSHQSTINEPEFVLSLEKNDFSLIDNLDKVIFSLSLTHIDNKTLADKIYKLMDNRQLLLIAEELDDKETLDKLRLLYVLAVNHPALTFHQRHHLLTIYLRHLDEVHEAREMEEERKREELEQSTATFDIDRPIQPSSESIITSCELKGVYKRQADKRYPYIIEVEWSDGALCRIHRTYGDFFSFQNKLLDLFPEESGQKNKKNRTIPFLPGRKLLSGKSNRELAEKRLPDLFEYTRKLFSLPDNVTTCKHVLDFFRPRPSDIKEESLTHRKVTTVADVRSKEQGKKVAFNKGSPLTIPHSATVGTGGVVTANSGQGYNTLPANQSPGLKDSAVLIRRSTYPARPSGSIMPSESNEHLHSSSQNSLASGESQTTPITPTINKPVRSSVGSHGNLDSGSGNVEGVVTKTSSKLKRASKNLLSKEGNSSKNDAPPTAPPTSSWADRSTPPPNVESNLEVFKTPSSTVTLTVTPSSITNATPPSVTSTTPASIVNATPSSYNVLGVIYTERSLPCSPSLPQLYSPHIIHGRMESPSPVPLMGVARNATPTCRTPLSEFEHCKNWLKFHRLHKYENLFQNCSFEEVSQLTVEKLKEMGMTQGAAKKLQQKMEELIKANVTSFHEIPHASITRRPSTTSLPAAILLERQQLTPSSSIDQLSLHGSTCSLDILGPSYHQHATPIHSNRHSDSMSDVLMANVDTAILETGPKTGHRGVVSQENHTSRILYKSPIDVRYSVPCGSNHTSPGESGDNPMLFSNDIKSTNRINPSPHHFSGAQYHRKDHAHSRMPHPQILTGSMPGIFQNTSHWSHQLVGVPSIIRPHHLRTGYVPANNGMIRGGGAKRITCYSCGNKGHYGADCTSLKFPHQSVTDKLTS